MSTVIDNKTMSDAVDAADTPITPSVAAKGEQLFSLIQAKDKEKVSQFLSNNLDLEFWKLKNDQKQHPQQFAESLGATDIAKFLGSKKKDRLKKAAKTSSSTSAAPSVSSVAAPHAADQKNSQETRQAKRKLIRIFSEQTPPRYVRVYKTPGGEYTDIHIEQFLKENNMDAFEEQLWVYEDEWAEMQAIMEEVYNYAVAGCAKIPGPGGVATITRKEAARIIKEGAEKLDLFDMSACGVGIALFANTNLVGAEVGELATVAKPRKLHSHLYAGILRFLQEGEEGNSYVTLLDFAIPTRRPIVIDASRYGGKARMASHFYQPKRLAKKFHSHDLKQLEDDIATENVGGPSPMLCVSDSDIKLMLPMQRALRTIRKKAQIGWDYHDQFFQMSNIIPLQFRASNHAVIPRHLLPFKSFKMILSGSTNEDVLYEKIIPWSKFVVTPNSDGGYLIYKDAIVKFDEKTIKEIEAQKGQTCFVKSSCQLFIRDKEIFDYGVTILFPIISALFKSTGDQENSWGVNLNHEYPLALQLTFESFMSLYTNESLLRQKLGVKEAHLLRLQPTEIPGGRLFFHREMILAAVAQHLRSQNLAAKAKDTVADAKKSSQTSSQAGQTDQANKTQMLPAFARHGNSPKQLESSVQSVTVASGLAKPTSLPDNKTIKPKLKAGKLVGSS